ncbi:transmembrane protein 94 [Bemisia tabaci]|uniref:transmembrane protein 94 n=1 Tax=Bemisia tabaci TaxID=7038 RepID=UPI003B286371
MGDFPVIQGLPTKESLKRLHDDIADFLILKTKERKKRSFYSLLWEAANPRSVSCSVPWTSLLIICYCFISLILSTWVTNPTPRFFVIADASLIITLAAVNLLYNMWDIKLKSDEIYKRTEFILSEIKETHDKTEWKAENYPPLYTPVSPCITLQWVYRDGRLVTLPWALLVAGDTVLIRPGQVVPGNCIKYLNDKADTEDQEPSELKFGETYAPIPTSSTIGQLICRKPNACKPVNNIAYTLTETPYLRNLRTCLSDHPNRPITVFERKRYQFLTIFVQLLILPSILIVIFIINLARWFKSDFVDEFSDTDWRMLLLIQPVITVLPLLPLAHPICWLFLNCLGNSLLLSTPKTEVKKKSKFSAGSEEKFLLNWASVGRDTLKNVTGQSHHLVRSSNLLHVLGSLTGLCFVDKEGVLSWPNPSADAICFLKKPDKYGDESKENDLDQRNNAMDADKTNEDDLNENKVIEPETTESTPFLRKELSSEIPYMDNISFGSNSVNSVHMYTEKINVESSKKDELSNGLTLGNQLNQIDKASLNNASFEGVVFGNDLGLQMNPYDAETSSELAGNERAKTDGGEKSPKFVREILDISHDKTNDFSLQFDDATWSRYMNSLKPIGLAILLNTCNPGTIENYAKFSSHVSCQAHHYNQNKLTFYDRRCLCEIAKQIGFVEDKVLAQFKIKSQVFIYKHVRERFLFRTYKSTKVKSKLSGEMRVVPFPHLVSTVYEKFGTDEVHMLTQGTFDVVMDACIEYFDGKTVHPLTKVERKSLESFYKHAVATGYCTVFSFRALSAPIPKEFTQVYLEIPCIAQNLYEQPYHYVSSFNNCSLIEHYCSSDNINEGTKRLKAVHPSDAKRCFQQNCNQIFLGMVSMQYQALIDVVQLIEGIERACIRFIFFSVENAQRAGPFHEKLGKEAAGWNCHISLENEKKDSNKTTDILKKCGRDGYKTEASEDRCRLSSCFRTSKSLRHIRKLSRSLSASATFPESCFSKIQTPDSRKNSYDVSPFGSHTSDDTKLNFQLNPVSCETVDTSEALLFSDVEKCLTSNRSLSCASDDSGEPAPPDYALPNISKLPVGIENVRDHLERVDNVPLLISLFVDCTPENTREMLLIRQENNEVDCVLGSSANAKNAGVFVQANVSVAVEPMYPQLCQKIPLMMDLPDGYSPCALSSLMNSLPCALYLRTEDIALMYSFIMEARNFMSRCLGVFQFWMVCSVASSLIQIITAVFNLPNPFGIGQMLYLSCILLPFLSVSLIIGAANPEVMQRSIGKNKFFYNFEGGLYILKCYGTKLVPLIIVIPLIYALCLDSMQSLIIQQCLSNSTTVQCSSDTKPRWSELGESFCSLQRATFLLLVIHFVITSVSFIDREYLIWQKLPQINITWFLVAFFIILVQVTFTVLLDLLVDAQYITFLDLPMNILYLAYLSPLVSLLFNELISKYIEINENTRIRRKIKLEFNTKLGMNSPF